MRNLIIYLAAIVLPISAAADSFCEYEAGLIGTKALGSIFPAEHNFQFDYDFETGHCQLAASSQPDIASKISTFACTDFKQMPTINSKPGVSLAYNDYFSLLVFDVKNGFVAIESSNSDERLWVKWGTPNADVERFDPLFYWQKGAHLHYSAKLYDRVADEEEALVAPLLYSEPKLSEFLKGISGYFPDPDMMLEIIVEDGYRLQQSGLIFNQDLTETDRHFSEDGTLWIEAEERVMFFQSSIPRNFRKQLSSDDLWEPWKSPIIRKVFFKAKSPDGVLLSVPLSILGCLG